MVTANRVAGSDVLLVKLRPSSRLGTASDRVGLEPLHSKPAGAEAFGLNEAPQWFLARPEPAETAWDQAHARVAAQLGIDESDVLFVEPDFVHGIFAHETAPSGDAAPLAIGEDCAPVPQDGERGKALGPNEFAWHLGRRFTQLGKARSEVEFSEPRVRIAHIDTGYQPSHETVPKRTLRELERNFVDRDGNPTNATDPDNNRLILDSSGHGTGTLSILAGGPVSAEGGFVMGAAPDAEVLPIRVADSVVLLRTSALARGIRYAVEAGCQVATLSMGGVPARAWAEAVDEAYEAGLCLCAAAGNHVGFSPPRTLVYPARYDRVIAVAGVMANGKPYDGLKGLALEGSFGPESAMEHAIATYTPNIPWAKFGCRSIVRLNGEGTSSATPQVAAAAALWIEKYKDVLPNDWRRVEAVRHALFSTAKSRRRRKHFGNGILQAHRALAVKPLMSPAMSDRSSNSFSFLRVVTGLGIDEPTPREEMFNIELTQRWLLNDRLQEIVPDPDCAGELSRANLRAFMEAVIEDEEASLALRRHCVSRYPTAGGRSLPGSKSLEKLEPELPPVRLHEPEVPTPPFRRIRIYATDPSLSRHLDTADTNEITLQVRWEKLTKGPVGEYLEIEDKGPRSYPGVNLNDASLLARDGWAPSEVNPQFHQQMVYAVAMKTIEHFEHAFGRPVLWTARKNPEQPYDDSKFVRRLVIRPHALQEANAYYSPQQVALLFGYFSAGTGPGDHLPGSPVYTCLSHDIVAHETTHAILDGMYPRFNEPSNPDVLAFHEAFADIVALLQHFTIPELLVQEIARTRGDLEAESLLGKLAIEFGQVSSGRGALRSAIGTLKDGVWTRTKPAPMDPSGRVLRPHARGAHLVGAVFDALIAIYNKRIADLLRIHTGGTGILPDGAINPDLVVRLADEAAKSAHHVLTMCIRAIDYLPPVDVTFFDFLRALITADFEMVSHDRLNYRVAFVEAFSRRGIYPGPFDEQARGDSRALSPDTLRWQGFSELSLDPSVRPKVMKRYRNMVEQLKIFADACLYISDREQLFQETRNQRAKLQRQLKAAFRTCPEFGESLGIESNRSFEVHTLRRAMRVRPDQSSAAQVFVSLTQTTSVGGDDKSGVPSHRFRGGSTLVLDLSGPALPKYRIMKRITSARRRAVAGQFHRGVQADPLRRLFLATDGDEPFAAVHGLAEEQQ